MAITAAMPSGTGLDRFAEVFPERCYDVGIAEQHAVTFAGGLAVEGFKPFAAIYSTFLQRAYDQVVHDVAVQQPPRSLRHRPGGACRRRRADPCRLLRRAYLSCLPGFVVMAASDEAELMHMVATAAAIDDRPSAFRYPRGEGMGVALPKRGEVLPLGKGRILREGTTVAILSFGARLAEVVAGQRPARRLRPFHHRRRRALCQAARRGLGAAARPPPRGAHHPRGRLGGRLRLACAAFPRPRGVARPRPEGPPLVLPDVFIEQTNRTMYEKAGLNAAGIVATVFAALGKDLDALDAGAEVVRLR